MALQPWRKRAAAPQMRPWQAPMPQRVSRRASPQEWQAATALTVMSSQRHNTVCGSASALRSSRKAK